MHADNLRQRVPFAELAGVADAEAPIAREIGELNDVPWWTSLDEALQDSEVDGVVIATPTSLHPEMVELAASAGKHVFCEKPLGFDVESSQRAVVAVREAGVQLQVGFQRRFDSDWLEMKRALDSGSLGEFRLFRSTHRNAHDAPMRGELGDVYVDITIHDLDAACWLGGKVAELFALTATGGGAAIALRFASGAVGLIDASRATRYGFDCTAEVVGSQATVRTGYQHRRGAVELLRDGRAATELPANHAERHASAYVCELERFGELALGDRESDAPGEAAVVALELALAARRSAESGEPIRVEVDYGAVGATPIAASPE